MDGNAMQNRNTDERIDGRGRYIACGEWMKRVVRY